MFRLNSAAVVSLADHFCQTSGKCHRDDTYIVYIKKRVIYCLGGPRSNADPMSAGCAASVMCKLGVVQQVGDAVIY